MISTGNTLTQQGMMFGNGYQQMIFGKQQPAPAPTTVPVQPTSQAGGGTPNPTATSAPTSYSSFSFEDGTTGGWSGHGDETVAVQNSTTVAMDGKHSLQVSLVDVGTGDFPFVSVGQSHLASYPQAGQTISMYVYVPGNLNGLGAKVFVMDSQYHWFDPGAMTQLKPGTWNRLTFTLPSGVTGPLRQLGIQFNNLSNALMSTSMYIDAVNWT